MKVINSSINQLINNSSNPELFKELYFILQEQIKEEGKVFKTNSGKLMIGFKYVNYKNTNYNGKWPLISIASQKTIYQFIYLH